MAVAKEKKQEQQKTNSITSLYNRMVEEVRKIIAELRKVVWPTRDETIRLTIVVILISAAIGFFLFVGDTIFISLYSFLIEVVQ